MNNTYLASFNQSLKDQFGERSNLIKRIKAKGWQEQELQYRAPSVYGNKAVTKRTKGLFKQYEITKKKFNYSKFN